MTYDMQFTEFRHYHLNATWLKIQMACETFNGTGNGTQFMHELAVTQSLVNIALRHATGARVTDLYLVVGQLSSMIDDSVQFYWDILSQGTAAEGAQLHFRRVPAEMQCFVCHHHFVMPSDTFACPSCGSAQVSVVAGDEFYLESIEVQPREVSV